jgi:hypothetical protein
VVETVAEMAAKNGVRFIFVLTYTTSCCMLREHENSNVQVQAM